MKVHRGGSTGSPGYPGLARQPWGKNCGAGCVLPVVQSHSSMATPSVQRLLKILAAARATGLFGNA